MTEDFLHFIWQYQYFDRNQLKTSQLQNLTVLDLGKYNLHAGADFEYAKILLNEIEWVGSIEIHLKSSDWDNHHHQQNPAYNNVILHVVWEDDKPIQRADQTPIPTLELKNRVNQNWLHKYQQLIHNQLVIPCASQFQSVDNLKKMMMLDKALSQRLEAKAEWVKALWQSNHQDWEETTYQLLAKNFGFKVNNEAFLRLTQNLPLKILLKYRNDLTQIEALLFGQAGFLESADNQDDYYLKLQKEYQYLAHKHQLKTIQLSVVEWKFMRLRPANFPTVRLAQFAQLIYENPSLFSLFIQSEIKDLKEKLPLIQSEYWQNHYQFGKKSAKKVPHLGKSATENLLINTVVPLLAAYSQVKANQDFMDKAIAILESLLAEDNHILKIWADLGLKVKTAFDSQALIELYNEFCQKKKCLQCVIGVSLVKKD